VAFAVQFVLEQESSKFFKHLVKKYKQKDVAVAGGIFLNVKFNTKLLQDKIVNNLFIYPNPADGGVAVGAAIALYKKLGENFKVQTLENSYLGCSFTRGEIKSALREYGKKLEVRELGDAMYSHVAREIASGKVIGWFQGRSEWGPRALGARSVLADPRNIKTKERINKYLKQRDWFMPFAPVILDEYKLEVLEHGYATPFMTLTDNVKKAYLKKIPAAVHIDGTARAQVIKKESNKPYWEVLNEFRKLTGIPVLLNTSFNKHGLPIVHTPKDAIEHLLWGCVDELVIGNYLVETKKSHN
jgi:carbamoyltransferase